VWYILLRLQYTTQHQVATMQCPSHRRAHAAALRAAADEWQMRRGFERVLTMGFLGGAQPIVDLYELKVVCLRSCVCIPAESFQQYECNVPSKQPIS
jgi:hypothetical protein